MYSYLRDGISVVAMQDARKPNKKGDYSVEIRVNHKRRREHSSIGISMSKSGWDNLYASKTSLSRDIKTSIESTFKMH